MARLELCPPDGVDLPRNVIELGNPTGATISRALRVVREREKTEVTLDGVVIDPMDWETTKIPPDGVICVKWVGNADA